MNSEDQKLPINVAQDVKWGDSLESVNKHVGREWFVLAFCKDERKKMLNIRI